MPKKPFSVLSVCCGIGVCVPSAVFAAGGAFFSLRNTDFVVLIGFALFVGILFWFKVPRLVGTLLTARADKIKADLEAARAMRDEAQNLLSAAEKKEKSLREQSERIQKNTRAEADYIRKDMETAIDTMIEQKIKLAQEQQAAERAAALADIRNQATAIAIDIATTVIATHMHDSDKDALIADATRAIDARFANTKTGNRA